MGLNLTIDSSSEQTISESFESIAIDLFSHWILQVNEYKYRLTEIEFYYFHNTIHPDTFTQEHEYPAGNWRFHLQGIDISLGYGNEYDGGILLRGIKCISTNDPTYINGPKRVLAEIFKRIGSVTNPQQVMGIVEESTSEKIEIHKTFRHGLGKTGDQKYAKSLYRFFSELENWDIKQVAEKTKSEIGKSKYLINVMDKI